MIIVIIERKLIIVKLSFNIIISDIKIILIITVRFMECVPLSPFLL